MDDAERRKGVNKLPTTLSAKEVAQELGTDARTVRKFLRKTYGTIGQGNRWNIQRKEIAKLRKAFNEWAKPPEPKESKVTPTKVVDLAEEIDDIVELEDIDDLEDE